MLDSMLDLAFAGFFAGLHEWNTSNGALFFLCFFLFLLDLLLLQFLPQRREVGLAAHHTWCLNCFQGFDRGFVLASVRVQGSKLEIGPIQEVFVLCGFPAQQDQNSDLPVVLTSLLIGSESGFEDLTAAIVECGIGAGKPEGRQYKAIEKTSRQRVVGRLSLNEQCRIVGVINGSQFFVGVCFCKFGLCLCEQPKDLIVRRHLRLREKVGEDFLARPCGSREPGFGCRCTG